MRSLLIRTATASLLLLTAVSSNSANEGTSYQREGMRFTYPPGWKIVASRPESKKLGTYVVSLAGPSSAIVKFTIAPAAYPETLSDFSQSSAKERTLQLALLNSKAHASNRMSIADERSETTTARFSGTDQTGILQSFTMKIGNVDVPHEARIFLVSSETRKLFITTQTPTEDLSKSADAVNAILDSVALE